VADWERGAQQEVQAASLASKPPAGRKSR